MSIVYAVTHRAWALTPFVAAVLWQSVDPLATNVVVPALVGAISLLAGAVYKLQQDRIKSQDTQIAKLTDLNGAMQKDFDKTLSVSEAQGHSIDRILTIVEDIRYDGLTRQQGSTQDTTRPHIPTGGKRPAGRRPRPVEEGR